KQVPVTNAKCARIVHILRGRIHLGSRRRFGIGILTEYLAKIIAGSEAGMKRIALAVAVAFTSIIPQLASAQSADDVARWQKEAQSVTITRDDWGIAHVRGRTDADAVFGMIYAQAEDDFNRVETNYLTALGWTARAEGEGAIWADLRARLYMRPEKLKADYAASPLWLRRLMEAWADGLNHYLATHPDVHPLVIAHFEPWMAMSFTEGSI